jgi:phosphate transport system permease protein
VSAGTDDYEWAGGASVLARFRGGVFKYTCLGTALFGIVTLVILLGYVAVDAFELRQAAPAWYLVYALTLVAPTAVFWWHTRGTPPTAVAKTAVGGVLMGLGLGAFLVVAFVIATPYVWAACFLVAVVPAVAVVAYGGRFGRIENPEATALGVLALGLVVTTLGLGPLTGLAELAKPWLLYLLTVAVPVAAGFAWWSGTRDDRVGIGVAVVLVCSALAVGLFEEVGALASGGMVIPFVVGFTLPVAVVLASALRRPPAARIGLLAPVLIVIGLLVGSVTVDLLGIAGPDSWLHWAYLQQGPSRTPENAGLYPPIIGSIFMIVVMIVAVFPLGVGAAIYLEEYAPSNRLTQLVQVNLANLAGVPSVVYGLLGLAVIARRFGFGLGTVLTAGLTVGLLVLPIVIVSSQEAIRSVPTSVRQASYGMGASRWQTTREIVLPEAFAGILTGTILALGRAVGETAPLVMIGAATAVSSPPNSLFSTVTAMPLQIFSWRSHFDPDFRYGVVAAGVIVLLVVLLGLNAAAIVLRNRYETR